MKAELQTTSNCFGVQSSLAAQARRQGEPVSRPTHNSKSEDSQSCLPCVKFFAQDNMIGASFLRPPVAAVLPSRPRVPQGCCCSCRRRSLASAVRSTNPLMPDLFLFLF